MFTFDYVSQWHFTEINVRIHKNSNEIIQTHPLYIHMITPTSITPEYLLKFLLLDMGIGNFFSYAQNKWNDLTDNFKWDIIYISVIFQFQSFITKI
jgi:hypothetical protein